MTYHCRAEYGGTLVFVNVPLSTSLANLISICKGNVVPSEEEEANPVGIYLAELNVE